MDISYQWRPIERMSHIAELHSGSRGARAPIDTVAPGREARGGHRSANTDRRLRSLMLNVMELSRTALPEEFRDDE